MFYHIVLCYSLSWGSSDPLSGEAHWHTFDSTSIRHDNIYAGNSKCCRSEHAEQKGNSTEECTKSKESLINHLIISHQ